ncbi:MAG: hypothetical protein ABL962_02045, partial [Fimbriimonadaceae bacterium]
VGTEEFVEGLKVEMAKLHGAKLSPTEAKNKLKTLWDKTFPGDLPEGYEAECMLLSRENGKASRFVALTQQS